MLSSGVLTGNSAPHNISSRSRSVDKFRATRPGPPIFHQRAGIIATPSVEFQIRVMTAPTGWYLI